jgi:hypothetical protein
MSMTMTATWPHFGAKPPYRVQSETLDLAEAVLISLGYEVIGTASGYAVQENESDVSVTIHETPPLSMAETIVSRLAQRTGKTWKVAEA